MDLHMTSPVQKFCAASLTQRADHSRKSQGIGFSRFSQPGFARMGRLAGFELTAAEEFRRVRDVEFVDLLVDLVGREAY
jgi:hypothetical protein